VWVEILLDKYFSDRPRERFAGLVATVGLGLGTRHRPTDGLARLEVLLRPIHEALKERNPQGDLHQADENRVVVVCRSWKASKGYGWWLWVRLGPGHG